MKTSKELILRRLAEECEKTIATFEALEPEAWAERVYTDGAAWTPHEILAHQVTTERAILALVQDVLAGGPGAPDAFDVRAFNEARAARLAGVPPRALYAQFRAARAATRAMVERMTPADFDRTGRHPWFGQATLEEMLKLLYRHNMLHARDVERAASAARPRPGP